MRIERALIAVIAVGVACLPGSAWASTATVSGGTLAITSSPGENVIAGISNDQGRGGSFQDAQAVLGPCCGNHDFEPSFALMANHGVFQGTGPLPGPGCSIEAATAILSQHVVCREVQRIAVTLGSGDDLVRVQAPELSAPVIVHGGPGSDGLGYAGSGAAMLDGGPGNDGLYILASGASELDGGPGDDLIDLDYRRSGDPLTVSCGPGDDTIRAWHYGDWRDKPAIDTKSCPPILQWVGALAPPPPGETTSGVPLTRVARRGRIRVRVFRPTEALHGTLRLMNPVHRDHDAYPVLGTSWRSCSTRAQRFSVRRHHVVGVQVTLPRAIMRRVLRTPEPSARTGPASFVSCAFHVRAVDPQGERVRDDLLTVWLTRPRR